MDKNKQPGIRVEQILFPKVSCIREPVIPENISLSLELKNEGNAKHDDKTVQVALTAHITEKESNCFEITVTAIGVFSVTEGEDNLSLNEFQHHHAPAILFPYIREYITTLSVKAGMDPIILPPTNFLAFKDTQDTNKPLAKNSKE